MYSECRHIKTSGTRCHSPALSGHAYCFFHARLHGVIELQNADPKQVIHFPPLEDRRAVQFSVGLVMDAIASSRIDQRTASLLLYAIQIGVQALPRNQKENEYDRVRETCCEEDGELMAPEVDHCDPSEDCDGCEIKDECIHPNRINFRGLKRIYTQYRNGYDEMDRKEREREARYAKPDASTK
jgi:hypothetical protein